MPQISVDFDPLFTLLDSQMSINRQLLMLAVEQRQSIIDNNLENLDDLVRKQSGELMQLANFEKKRLAAVAQIKKEIGLPDRTLALSELIFYALPNQKQRLQNLIDEFAALLNELKEINNTNKLLLRTGIELNELLINIFTENGSPLNNLYRGDGSKAEEGPVGPSIFDHQI